MAAGTEGSFLHMSKGLKRALKVGQGFLAKKDIAALMQAIQPDDVPDADWEKLNREATFKQKYTKRSGEIQEILGEMLQTFKDNLAEAEAAEKKAADDSSKLLKGKNDSLDTKQSELRDQAGENGARGESKADSEEQKRDMEGQNSRDEKYIEDTQKSCATKADEWAERKRLRSEEKASIQQAIATLRSDDARDLFKKSFDSHGALFLQTSASVRKVEHHPKLTNALSLIKRTAVKSGDYRLLLVAQQHAGKAVSKGDPFAAVTKDIDGFIADLKKEEEADMAEKEMCEKERAERTGRIQIYSKQIDMSTSVIGRLSEHIAACQKQVDEINVEIKDNEDAKREATEIRNKEKVEYGESVDDDTAAGQVVENAIAVLKSFYENNELNAPGFMQVRAVQQEPGEAPTPPPSTWDDTYKGASGETGGIVALMEGIKADIE